MIGIYKITNKLNGKSYIGQSIHCGKRYKEHCRGKNQFIDETIQLEGEENFTFELLEECSKEELNEREDYYIEKYNTMFPNGYNKRWNTSNFTKASQQEKKVKEYYIYQYNGLGEIETVNENFMAVFEEHSNSSYNTLQKGNNSQSLKTVQQYRSEYFPNEILFNFNLKQYKNNEDANFSPKEYRYYQNFLLQICLILAYYTQNKISFNTYPFLVQPQYIEMKMPPFKGDNIKKQITMFKKLQDRKMINQLEFYDINNQLLILPAFIKVKDIIKIEYIRIF